MDANKKNRAELKRFFVKNALPTESNFADLIDAGLNQKDDGLVKNVGEALSVESAATTRAALRLYESFTDANAAWTLGLQDNTTAALVKGLTLSDRAGNTRLFINGTDGSVSTGPLTVSGALNTGALSATGAVSANLGLTVTGAPLNVGTSAGNAQRLAVWGALNANGGVIIPSGQTLSVGGPLSAGGGLTVTGAAVNVGTSAANAQPLNVWGALSANGGLTVRGGLNADSISLTTSTALFFPGLTTTGLLNANAGLIVTGGALNVGTSTANAQPLNVWGTLAANSGLTVTGGALNVGTSAATAQSLNVWGLLTANGGLTVSGQPLNVTGSLTAGAGITVNGILPLTVNSSQGLQVVGGPLNVGTSAANAQQLNVWGPIFANRGLTVTGAGVTIGTSATSPQPLTVWGDITANDNAQIKGLLYVEHLTNLSGGTYSNPISVNSELLAEKTLSVRGAMSANAGLTVTGGALNAIAGLNVTGNPLNVGTSSSDQQTLNAWGPIFANRGLTVTGAGVTIGTSATSPQPLTVWGSIIANDNAQIKGLLYVEHLTNLSGGTYSNPISVNSELLAEKTLSVRGAMSANAGLTVTGGALNAIAGLNVTGNPLNVGTSSSDQQTLNAWGPIFANRGLTVTGAGVTIGTSATSPQPLTVWGSIIANGGLTVAGGGLFLGTAGAPQGLLVTGTLNASSGVLTTSSTGVTVAAPLTANSIIANGITNSGRLTSTSTVNLTPPPRSGVRLDRAFSQYLSIPATSINFSNGFTIQAWVYVTSYGGPNVRILELGVGQASDNIVLAIDPDGFLLGQVYKGSVPSSAVRTVGNAGSRVPLSTWTHVAFSVDQNGSAKMYVKGVLWLSYSADATLVPNNVSRSSNFIGRSNWSVDQYFSGYLAEVSLWNVALAPSSITTASPTGTESGLVGYWRMNETSGSIAINGATTGSTILGNATLATATSGAPLPTFGSVFDRVQQTTISQEEWITPTLQGKWTPHGGGFNNPGFFRDSLGIVHLRGLIDNPGGATLIEGRDAALPIMTLPAGYRPIAHEIFSCIGGNQAARVDILADGSVYLISGISGWVSMDGLTFRAAQ